MRKEIKLGKTILLEYGKHADGKRWFSFFLHFGTFASFFCSYRTQAYDTGFQSGIGHIFRWPIRLEQYLSMLEYPQGTVISEHQDGDPNSKQLLAAVNINFVLRKADVGGEFICPEAILNTSRLKIFNGDKYHHQVTPVEKGKRVVLAYKFSLSHKKKSVITQPIS